MNESNPDPKQLQERITKLEAELEKLKPLEARIEALKTLIPATDVEQCKRDVKRLTDDATKVKEQLVPEALARLITPEVIGKVINKETMTQIVDSWYRRSIDTWKFWIQLLTGVLAVLVVVIGVFGGIGISSIWTNAEKLRAEVEKAKEAASAATNAAGVSVNAAAISTNAAAVSTSAANVATAAAKEIGETRTKAADLLTDISQARSQAINLYSISQAQAADEAKKFGAELAQIRESARAAVTNAAGVATNATEVVVDLSEPLQSLYTATMNSIAASIGYVAEKRANDLNLAESQVAASAPAQP